MIHYSLGSAKQLTKQDMEDMIRKIETTFHEGSELAMTLADILREERLQQGLQQGKIEALSQTAKQPISYYSEGSEVY